MSKRPKDPDAFERKVRPIYDALDSRNWKGALKLCQQALQKYPDNELVKVLKAIGLDRSGKREEANQVVDEVAATNCIDEQVLRLAAMVFRASGRLAAITRMYEAAAAAAAAAQVGGELALLLLHEVFGAHVRESNFVKQQQVALRLGKAAVGATAALAAGGITAERYGWWVVMSILLQARAALRARASGVAAPPGQVPAVALEPERLLALAEGMISRQASKDGRLEGYEALMVYVDVMLAQGKAPEALALVSGPMGAAAIRLPAERLQLRAVLSALAGDLGGAAALLREGLALNPDDWGALLLLLDCLLPGTAAGLRRPQAGDAAAAASFFVPQHPLVLISGGVAEQLPPRGVPVPDCGGASSESFSEAEAVLRELVALGGDEDASGTGGDVQAAGGGKAMTMRGPDLALVELAMRRHCAVTASSSSGGGGGGDSDSNGDGTEAAVADAVLSYYCKYGSLVSCAVDLRTYVSQLGAAAAERLAAALQAEADAAVGGTAAATADGGRAALSVLRRRVCAAQIRDDLGLPRMRSCEEGVVLSREMMELYGTAQPLQEGLDERERGAADELPVLAAAALVTSAALAPSDAAAVPYMLAAYGALADAVRQRPFGAGMRISLAALAALLAAPAAAATHLYKLDIKHVQLDTLGGHLLLPALLAWPAGGGGVPPPAPQEGGQLLHKALRDARLLFDDHSRDAGETLFTAYNHGMYTKVLEFTAFRERLAAAHTLVVVRAEAAVADCLRGSSGSSAGSSSSGSSTGGPAAATSDGVMPGAMRTAAAAAAGGLPVGDMPIAGSLRFNWDLSTRPTWLPPCAATPSLHGVEWWRIRGRAGEICGQGYGRCWWSATSSAEGPSAPAAEWRAAQLAAATHRWLVPHCIAGALGATGGPGVLGLREAVERLRGLGGAPGAAAGSDDLRQLDVLLYGTALAVQEHLAAVMASSGAPDGGAEADVACSSLAALAAAVRAATGAAAAGVAGDARAAAAWGGVLPGGSLGAMSHLLREPLQVAAACVQSWQTALKALRKRRAKAGTQLEDAGQRLCDAVAAAATQLAEAARECGDALAAATSVAAGTGEAAAAAQAARFLKEQGHAPSALTDTAVASLESLIAEQRSTVAALARQATAVAAALS